MLLTRQQVCDRLALSRWQSYQIFPTTKTGLIRETDVLQFVNVGRRGTLPSYSYVPQLVTAETVEKESGAPQRKLKLWAKRKRCPLPHIYFNSHVLRFPMAAALNWLEEHSK